MKFVSYEYFGDIYSGVVVNDYYYSFFDFGFDFRDMNDFLSRYSSECMDAIRLGVAEGGVHKDNIKLLAPIVSPMQDVICVGVNYLEHAKESAAFKGEKFEQREHAVYFSKRINEMVGPYDEIKLHSDITDELDYEVELGVVLCRDLYKASKQEVMDSIFGYTVMNDISARNLQKKHKQWYFGKSLDRSCVMGPHIVTSDIFDHAIPSLDIQCYVNGELRQSSNTKDMIFKVDELLCELSQGIRLKSGSILSTGTPSGVGMGFNPPKFLRGGDLVECSIEKIGNLKNFISLF